MGVQEDYRGPIKLLIELESTIADLYRVFAQKFPEWGDFWNGLVGEEHDHAGMLLTMITDDKVMSGFNPDRFDIDTIVRYLGLVRQKLEAAGNGEMTILEALTAASDIERGLVERNFYTVFKGDGAGARETFTKISQQTKNHGEKVRQAMERYKKKAI